MISYQHFLEDYFKTTIRTKDLGKDFFHGFSSFLAEYNLVDKTVQVFYLFVYCLFIVNKNSGKKREQKTKIVILLTRIWSNFLIIFFQI